MSLTEDQISRYSRHILLPEVGGAGQKKLLNAKVLIIGAGGLGAPVAYYLAAAGIGKIGIVDGDVVEISNLQRQIIHSTKDIGKSKAQSAREKMTALNPDIEVVTYETRVNSENILDIIKDYDAVVDGTDNFPTRYLVNDACVMAGKPLFHGGVFRFDGQAITIIPGQSACYRCLFPEPPPQGLVPSCQEAGILGVVVGTIGLIQATEVVKYFLGKGDLLTNRLIVYNALKMNFRTVKVPKDDHCAVCSENRTITELIDYQQFCGVAPH